MLSAPHLLCIFYSAILLLGHSPVVAAPTDASSCYPDAQQVLHPLPFTASLSTDGNATATTSRPFYLIAHRVLVAQGVKDALAHGANAIEIDMTAWKKEGWFACHDGWLPGRGDTAIKMFQTIAEERKAGKAITFVWLDIKNPDRYSVQEPDERQSSIQALQSLAQQILEPHGVRVLYGFYKSYQTAKNGDAYKFIRDSLDANEAINLNGESKEVAAEFDTRGPSNLSKRVMSYGYYNLPEGFGDCKKDNAKTCTQLRQAVASGKFGKVFGWTSAKGQDWYVDRLLGEAGVDGLIYGFKTVHYQDHEHTRAAAMDILTYIRKNPEKYHVAMQDESPW